MTCLIVATDFSALAENAVDYAAAIAKHLKARLVLFNAFTVPVPVANGLLTVVDFDNLLLDNQNRLIKRAEQIAQSHSILVSYESSYSIVPEELENLSAKYQSELVVLGMEPDSLTQNLWGNTTTVVIEKMNCPVLAVPERAHFDGLRKILFAYNVADGLLTNILPRVKALAQGFNADVEVLFVEERNGQQKSGHTEFNNGVLIAGEMEGVSFSYKEIKSDVVIDTIRQEIVAADADLLIMAPKVYGFWSSVLHRSKTRVMASGLTIPMLAIPA